MSPLQYPPILFLLGLSAIVSYVPFSTAAVIDDGTQKSVFQKGLRHRKKPANSSAVRPRSISNRKHQISYKLLESSPRQQEHSLTLSSRSDGTLLTSSSSTVTKRHIEDADLQCEDNQRLFRVEITTDRFPLETSWELVGVSSTTTTTVLKKDDFDTIFSLYVEEKCLESKNLCYQFTMYDSQGDGICCDFGPGSYKVEYDNQLIKEGEGNFGYKEESEFFGDGCASPSVFPTRMPTAAPTAVPSRMPTPAPTRMPTPAPTRMPRTAGPAPAPTIPAPFDPAPPDLPTWWRMPTPVPTPAQSKEPTAIPTAHSSKEPSYIPSSFPSRALSSPTSMMPSITFEPRTSPPTEELQDSITYDNDLNHRRFFPTPLLHENVIKGIASYHTWPNCSATEGGDRDGCVSIPKTIKHTSGPSWAGTLHSGKVPICTRRGTCDLQIPMSNNALQIDVVGAHLGHSLQSRAKVELISDEEEDMMHSTRVVVVADVNNDGRPDIIMGKDGLSNQLLINQGNGEFQEVAGALPDDRSDTRAIGVGDMNNDGFPDLIIGNRGEENKLLLNQGNGTFGYAPGVIPGGSLLTKMIVIADVNSDGDLDVVFLNDVGGPPPHVQVLLNQGEDSIFEEVSTAAFSFDTIRNTATSIAVADVNGDNHIDIILGNDETEPTRVLLNQGNGTFEELEGSIPNDSSSGKTSAIAVADLDGDGTIDLVIGNDNWGRGESPIQILLNQGNGTFEEGGQDVIPSGVQFIPWEIAVADMDGDGRLDILIGTSKFHPNYLLQNQGSGNFRIVEGAFDEVEVDEDTFSIAVSDVNADGRVDVIIGNSRNPIQILLNKEVGAYLEVPRDAIPGGNDDNSWDIAVADLDADGLPDLVVGNDGEPNQVLLNQGDGTFQEVVSDVSDGERMTRAVAVGDLNGDGLPDIVIGNNRKIQLMLNQGGGEFNESDVSTAGNSNAYALVLADVNGDGHLDILVGNFDDPNQVLLNQGDATFEDLGGAIPGNFGTRAIAVADLNNDKYIDIIIGNYWGDQPNQLLLNQGDGTFLEIELLAIPGEYRTLSIAVADVNGDGFIDIIIGNDGEPNQLLLNQGNAIFEEKVDALPSDASDTRSVAVADVDGDGRPDLLIGNYKEPNQLLLNVGDGNFKEAADRIPFEASSTHSIVFADLNNDGRLDIVIGNTSGERNQLLLFSECPDGGAPLHGSSWCFPCPSFMGRSTSVVGLPVCRECPPDHIQDESNEQCSPVPCSSFQERKMGKDVCTPCPDGSFYNNSVIRSESQPSSFLQEKRCVPCKAGTFHSNALHAAAVDQCNSCPSRLSSSYNSSTCSYCDEGFYLNPTLKEVLLDTSESQSNEKSCLNCPTDAKCGLNTTLETLGVPPKYWRDSLNTSILYPCEGRNPERCSNAVPSTSVTTPDDYCVPEFKGPLCKLCKEESKYFNELDGECIDCDNSITFLIKAIGVVVVFISGFWVARFMGKKFQSLRSRGFQTKVKILISFYQVAATFGTVYGMRLHEDVAGVLNFISYFGFGILDLLSVPADCVGSKKYQLLFIILSPIGFLMLSSAWVFLVSSVKKGNWKDQFLNVALVTFYLVLPGVSNSIFSIIQCQRFVTSDEPEEYSSYLIGDLSIECDRSDPRYAFLLYIFFVSLVLWPVLVNILWIYLISRIWHPVRTNRLTPLANACRFLWRDYQPSMLFWDVVDLIRKIFLTGVIACIDMRASTEVIRLIIAGVISFVYVVFLAMYRPYKRADDHYLAIISNILLTCCFLMGIILNICDDGYDWCEQIMGFESLYTASIVVVVLTLVTLVISVFFLLAVTFLTITHPVLTLKSGEKPNLVLNAELNCEYHAFFSHVWSTGQAKSHAIVRKMQLIMPGVRIWLDVDDIEGYGGNLEQAVSDSKVFIVFVSKDYFASKNCRREIISAIRLGKPVIVIYEGDKIALESMINECNRFCTGTTDDETLSKILQHLKHNSIPWVDENIYSSKALNATFTMLLANLPYYQSHPEKLEGGVYVPGELGDLKLTSAVNLIISRSNEGCSDIVNELISLAGDDSSLISLDDQITDANELNTSLLYEGEIDSTTSSMDRPFVGKRQVMILYLNQNIFEHNTDELMGMLKRVIDKDIEIILLHELDPERKGCKFDQFFHQTPMELLEEPYRIYSRSIAVPLYGYDDYRELGLKRLFCKLGAEEVSKGFFARISQSLRDSIFTDV